MTTETKADVRQIDTKQLRRLQEAATELNYNRRLPDEMMEQLDPDGQHLLMPVLIHEHAAGVAVEPHMRCEILFKLKAAHGPARGMIDITFEELEKLPRLDIED